MKIDVLNTEGKSTGRSVDLPDGVFGVEPNDHAIYLAVKQYLANQRQGTHKSKERGEITGSTRKIKKQKGTGTARAGSLKNPLFRGGGRVFGPRPRTYSVKLNKKVKRLARASALSKKMTEGNVKVVEDFTFDTPKTKSFVGVMSGLGVAGSKTMFIMADKDNNVYMSGRNVPKVSIEMADYISTYDVMNANYLVISESAVEKIKSTLS